MKNENGQLSKALAGKDDVTSNPITFDNFEERLAAGEPESVNHNDLPLPEIDSELLDAQYRVGNSTPKISAPIMTGNKPHVPDVAPPAKTVTGINPEEKVIATILKDSPLNQATLAEVDNDDENSRQVNQPPVVTKPKAKSFWRRFMGN